MNIFQFNLQNYSQFLKFSHICCGNSCAPPTLTLYSSSLYLLPSLSIYRYNYRCFYLYIEVSICVFTCLFIYLSFHLSRHLCIYLSIYLQICLLAHRSPYFISYFFRLTHTSNVRRLDKLLCLWISAVGDLSHICFKVRFHSRI